MLKLGLIGQSIAKSRAPALHMMLGELHGLDVNYSLHESKDASPEAFAITLQALQQEGYRGCNVTFPYKQIAVSHAQEMNLAVQRVGSTNTLAFGERLFAGNTDYTGFIRGYQTRMGDAAAGRVLILGAGGVGRAVAFALLELGATEIAVYDLNEAGAQSLANSLSETGVNARVVGQDELEQAALQADGLVNCTPIGHYKTPGIPLPVEYIKGQRWAFDAVYTPLDTPFLIAAKAAGLQLVTGFDLFFFQGLDAFEIFADMQVDPARVLEPFKARFDIKSELID